MEGKWDDGPFGSFHRACYQMYTSKTHIERLVRKRKYQNASPNEEKPLKQPMTRSSIASTDIKHCIICQDEKIDPNDRRSKEKLTFCQTKTSEESLFTSAKIRNDKRLLLTLESQDFIALEVAYHRSCYRDYTRIK